MSVIVLLADGARPDVLAAAMESGRAPALAQLREEGGGMHTLTTVFPSVTGPAYVPFLLGRFPGSVGVPGIRWFDRTRARCRLPGHARSYVGADVRHIDRDLDAEAPTIFELAAGGLGAMNMIGRGLRRSERLAYDARFALRAGWIHFRGDVEGWLDIDRDVGRLVARRVRERRPAFTYAAFMGVDKISHAAGHDAPGIARAVAIIDDTVARIRADAERAGVWDDTRLWVASDHGHSPVVRHDELAGWMRETGLRVLAHPWIYRGGADAALMVSGNAMAHLYLEPERRTRPWWPALAARWEPFVADLLQRPSVDLVLLPHTATRCEIRGRGRGHAMLQWGNGRYHYRPCSGDPLGLGEHGALSAGESYELSLASDYPDVLVQIAHLAGAARSGDLILSASRDHDFRGRYEPIPHVSSHGALHREHMLVPLLLDRPPLGTPRRTADVMPSALRALGLAIPPGLDGATFI